MTTKATTPMTIPSEFKNHSPFAPSASKRWLVCPGSVSLEAAQEDNESSVYAQWGSAAHLLAEMRLKRVLTARGLTNSLGKKIGDIAPELNRSENDFLDIKVDEEMIWVVQEYVIFCESILPKNYTPLGNRVLIEKRVKFGSDPKATGTIDFAYDDWPSTLHVVDLKTGAGVQVDAENNPQLACYALGVLNVFGTDFETVKMTIFQPRGAGESVRTCEMLTEDFLDEWAKRINNAIQQAYDEPNVFKSGDHCRWCKALSVCKNTKTIHSAITKTAETSLEPPTDPDTLARVLRTETIVSAYYALCKQEATKLIERGINVPGFKLVETWGRTKWDNEKQVANFLAEEGLDGTEMYAPAKLKTPAQLRKYMGKGYPKELDKLTTTPNNGLKLVPDSDKRVAKKSALEVFDEN